MKLLSTFRSARLAVILALCAVGFVTTPVPDASAHQPSAGIKMNILSGGFIFGATGGSGTEGRPQASGPARSTRGRIDGRDGWEVS